MSDERAPAFLSGEGADQTAPPEVLEAWRAAQAEEERRTSAIGTPWFHSVMNVVSPIERRDITPDVAEERPTADGQ